MTATFEQVEAQMKSRALQFSGLDALVKFDFGADGALYIDGKSAPPTVNREGGNPDTTLTISLSDFVKMGQGDLNPMMAFTMGKLKVAGNMGVAMKLAGMMED